MKKVLNVFLAPFNWPFLFVVLLVWAWMLLFKVNYNTFLIANSSTYCLLVLVLFMITIAELYTVQQNKTGEYKPLSCETAWTLLKPTALYYVVNFPISFLLGYANILKSQMEAKTMGLNEVNFVYILLAFSLIIVGFYVLSASFCFLISQDIFTLWRVPTTWRFTKACFWKTLIFMIASNMLTRFFVAALIKQNEDIIKVMQFILSINPFILAFIFLYRTPAGTCHSAA